MGVPVRLSFHHGTTLGQEASGQCSFTISKCQYKTIRQGPENCGCPKGPFGRNYTDSPFGLPHDVHNLARHHNNLFGRSALQLLLGALVRHDGGGYAIYVHVQGKL